MIVPICPICGHQMYFAGNIESAESTVRLKRYMCVNCPHVEDMICAENDDEEFLG